jgi:transposase-like protein
MVTEAKARGLPLTGPDGLFKLFTRNRAGNRAQRGDDEHLGTTRTRPSRTGKQPCAERQPVQVVISDAEGEVEINLAWDRESTFEPQIAKKSRRRLTDVDEVVLSP